jgi:hypothetical protein
MCRVDEGMTRYNWTSCTQGERRVKSDIRLKESTLSSVICGRPQLLAWGHKDGDRKSR